jgi:hypothetical protein
MVVVRCEVRARVGNNVDSDGLGWLTDFKHRALLILARSRRRALRSAVEWAGVVGIDTPRLLSGVVYLWSTRASSAWFLGRLKDEQARKVRACADVLNVLIH